MAKLSEQIKKQLVALLQNNEAADAVEKVFQSVSLIAGMDSARDVEEQLENVIKDGKTRRDVAKSVYLWAQRMSGKVDEDGFDDDQLKNMLGNEYVAIVTGVFTNWREVFAAGGEDVVNRALGLIKEPNLRAKVAGKLYKFAVAKYAKPMTDRGQSGGVNISSTDFNQKGDIVGRDKIGN